MISQNLNLDIPFPPIYDMDSAIFRDIFKEVYCFFTLCVYGHQSL